MEVVLIAGARPNFMKIAPMVSPLKTQGLAPKIIHTGQHYDHKMSDTFFEELGIPQPDVNLGVGSGSAAWQIAEVMQRLDVEFEKNPPGAVIVVGDVNSTVAATLTAVKRGITVVHVEAGLRSFDREMPEEINRLITDAAVDWLYTSEPSGTLNLRNEGVPDERIVEVGNVMIDTLFANLERAKQALPLSQLELEAHKYCVLTLHRPSNVDDPERLESILRAIHKISKEMPVVFPIHPRTKARIESFGFDQREDLGGYRALEPQGYLNMLSLVSQSRMILTDSGGLQEESTAIRVPCITLRENTERPITIEVGSNHLVGWREDDILRSFEEVSKLDLRIGNPPSTWDGKASERIAAHLAAQIEK